MDRKTELKFLFLILAVFIAACIETDIYLPAFPDMMVWFCASEGEIQSLLTWNFFGICLAGPVYGPLSDAFGRKRPLMIALTIFLAGSVGTLLAQSLDQMIWGRLLQGLGSGGCFTLGTAILFDAFQKDRAISAVNRLNTIVPLIMAGAPMLGGYLNHAFGFRSNFLAIGFFVLLSLIVCLFFFQETLPHEKRVALRFNSMMKDFQQALCSLPFWQITLVISLIFAGYIAFLSGSSVLFVVEFGISKKMISFVQAAILGGWVVASFLLKRSIAHWGHSKVKSMGITLCVAGALGFAVTAGLAPTDAYLLTTGMVIYSFGANWIIGLYFPEGMEILPHIKGIASSLMTSARLLVAALVVGLSSVLYNGTIYPLTAVIVGTVAVMLPTLLLYEKRRPIAPVQVDKPST